MLFVDLHNVFVKYLLPVDVKDLLEEMRCVLERFASPQSIAYSFVALPIHFLAMGRAVIDTLESAIETGCEFASIASLSCGLLTYNTFLFRLRCYGSHFKDRL
jgi:hypothetical protein